ncbi:histidine kinase dimerization/phospho-acceptor domain-containing protein, partial [Serratia ureilytica]|uniref:histidine kinase dimerization/phospho-acceptor domain-containing protein n=1 Tax=Serratia ureilytica TaxID=300181 RepID=UPI003D7495E4
MDARHIQQVVHQPGGAQHLLAALSHDLRTPLTVLFGQAEILTLDLAAEGSNHATQASQIRQQVLS